MLQIPAEPSFYQIINKYSSKNNFTFTARMRLYILFILLLAASCKPYTDPDPLTDPRISNPYCNDPTAINYNWGFPGIPDNSTCIYSSDLFVGNYIWRDSTVNSPGAVVAYDSVFATVTKIDSIHFNIAGRCGYDLKLTADKFLNIVIDSIDGNGQKFCKPSDTIVGSGLKLSFSDTTNFILNYTIFSDTGATAHESIFIKQ